MPAGSQHSRQSLEVGSILSGQSYLGQSTVVGLRRVLIGIGSEELMFYYWIITDSIQHVNVNTDLDIELLFCSISVGRITR